MLDKIEQIAVSSKKVESQPGWVSKSNASSAAYLKALEFYEEKSQYINTHKKLTDFRVKNNFQISASEIARAIKLSVPTLTSTSTYSEDFSTFLKSLNSKLSNFKDDRVEKTKALRAKGNRKKSKDELLTAIKHLTKDLEEVRKKSAEEQIRLLLQEMPAKTKKKLGFNI